MVDVLGHAIHDYYYKLSPGKLSIHNKFGTPDVMPIEVYFREEENMPELELTALELCSGKVLDIGAGAGSHALYLQQHNVDVTALEVSPLASAVMKHRGVRKIINEDVFNYSDNRYDTLLLLMNGVGLASSIEGLHKFLQHAKTLLLPGGQLVFDSSDVAYLYKKHKFPKDRYYGEIDFRYEYKRQKTEWFSWLYIDKDMLTKVANEEGWATEVLFEDDHDQYLARLVLHLGF
jgi:SAM-dependent methyltransferase